MTACATATAWHPPSSTLAPSAGVWRSASAPALSYPAEANDAFLRIEETSFWFRHRLECVRTVVDYFPPAGDIYDIGGGNGYMSAGLAASSWTTVLVEPGRGALNARERGIARVVQATLDDAGFREGSLPAAAAFDVIEHIADDHAFLAHLRWLLAPGGRFYCTVPALPALWSAEDESAGHFRRYREIDLARALRRAGFAVEFISPFFGWLVVPVFLFRTLPSRARKFLGMPPTAWSSQEAARDHRLPPAFAPWVARLQSAEIRRLRSGAPLRSGTSLLAVAQVST